MKSLNLAVGSGLLLAVFSASGAEIAGQAGNDRVTRYVNSFIGTSNFGTTNPGAICPNGMMSVTPFNVMGSDLNTWDKDSRWWSTPYSSDNCFFTGFSHVNLSGVGCPEVGLALTMPTAGPLQVDYHIYGSEQHGETSSPGYYACDLLAYGIKAEASATTRTAIERYTFPGGQGNILVNFGEGLTNETGAWIRKISETEIEGMRLAGTFCYNPQAVFPVYFAIRINKVPSKGGFWKKQPLMKGVEAEWTVDDGTYKIYEKYGREIAGDDIGYWFSFETEEGEQVELQMGVSFVSCENAWENLNAEQAKLAPGVSNFETVRAAAHDAWESDLSRIKVSGATDRDLEVFYTALYHTLIHPSILNDVNGEYPLMESDGVGRVPAGQNRYSVFSLWDTYRNVHQLMTLVYPERQLDMVRSMISMYKEWGWMPKWELFGRETFTMEGDPAIPVITDTWLKGLRDFDIETAYEAFVKSATTPGAQNLMRPDIDPYLEKGYVPLGFYSADASGDNSVSHALEYYIADYALSLLAEDLGHTEDATKFRAQSLQYKHYYCHEFGTLRPLNADGTFLEPFNPRQGENFEPVPGFHEGSAWNYTFYVPHDVLGLAKLMGGRKAFVNKLQKVFDDGLYDPANEPDIAYPYLFSYFKGEEWRTAKIVSELLDRHYTVSAAGLPGNDDTGTMSAWAVFSMMGFYPDCPGDPSYTLTTPRFDRVEITLNPSYCDGRDRLVITKGRHMKGRVSHNNLIYNKF
jgi:predicted alpha-1,2-mannosidase